MQSVRFINPFRLDECRHSNAPLSPRTDGAVAPGFGWIMELWRNGMFGRWRQLRISKLGTAVALAAALLTLGACADDDKKRSRTGGGTSVAFPAIPTEIPTLNGMAVTIDVSGGSDAIFGANAGNVRAVAPAGRVMEDDGRSLPSIDANFLTAGARAGGLVTYADLLAIDPSAVILTGGITVLELWGQDFYLPAGVTLDLADSPTEQFAIRAQGPGDVIRIDGNVWCKRGGENVQLILWSAANGTAVSVSGNVEAAGDGNTADGGSLLLIATKGDALLRGTVMASGGPSGNGGEVGLEVAMGDILLAPGMWVANGGAGDNGGAAGEASVRCGLATTFGWGFQANGGEATAGAGGGGGSLSVRCAEILTMNAPIEMLGGQSTFGQGGDGGYADIVGLFITGATAANLNGGEGPTGGNGGSLYFSAESVTGAAVVATANGGAAVGAQPSQGGNGGYLEVHTDGLHGVNLLLDGQARGGDGFGGGNGGNVSINGYSYFENTHLHSDVSGGNGTLGNGGDGGFTGVSMYSSYGEGLKSVFMECVADGGNGANGGDGGFIRIDAQGGIHNNVTAQVSANGGDGLAGGGGNGGHLQTAGSEGSSDWSMNLTLSGSMSGGAASEGSGGNGGNLNLEAPGDGGWYRVDVTGTFGLRGGAADGLGQAAGQGGMGGRVFIYTGMWKLFESDNFNIDMRGGDSAEGNGGNGASPGRGGSNPGFLANCGAIDIRGGTINLSGGTGSLLGGQGFGGGGGQARFFTWLGDIHFGGVLLASGGDGAGGGGDAISDGEAVEFNADVQAMQIAGAIYISGIVRANGGDCTGADGNGGDGGYIWINNMAGIPVSGGQVFVSGSMVSRGGNGAGQGTGGTGWGIEISSGGSLVSVSGELLVAGGTGTNGGSAFGPWIATGANTEVTISGMVQAIAGNGTAVGGDASTIEIGSPSWGQPAASITVAGSGVVRSTAGNGPTNGATGFIELDAQGTAGANVTLEAGSVVEVLDGDGNAVPANVVVD